MGRVVGYHLFNPGTSVAYLQLFDASAIANVSLGSTVPFMSLGVGAGAAAFIPVSLQNFGYDFVNGLVIASTLTFNGSGAANANMIANLVTT